MDWSAIFAGIAALTSIGGLVYSVRRHRDNIRKEFLLWAVERVDAADQRKARRLIYSLYYLDTEENKRRRQELIEGIEKRTSKVLHGEDYSNIRSVFGLFNNIGYFWTSRGYGGSQDILALFPQIIELWDMGQPIVYATRRLPNQEKSFIYLEKLVNTLRQAKRE